MRFVTRRAASHPIPSAKSRCLGVVAFETPASDAERGVKSEFLDWTGLGRTEDSYFFRPFSPRTAMTFCRSFHTSPFAFGLRRR